MSEHLARNHGWCTCLGEDCPVCALGVPPRGIPSFAEALAEPPHGRLGANEAVDEANCQRAHGMSRAEWDALPEPTGDPDS